LNDSTREQEMKVEEGDGPVSYKLYDKLTAFSRARGCMFSRLCQVGEVASF